MKRNIGNEIKLGLLTILLGAFCGAVIWLFLRLLGICTGLIWDTLIPAKAGFKYLPVLICAAGGLLAGLVRKRYGDYPEELHQVLGKVRKEKHYDYSKMAVILVCAFIPLVFGASVGPEAGLTGIIAGLCYWVGDNVKYAKEHAEEYSEIGAAVTLGSLFHVPLFGIFAVEEDPEADGAIPAMPKASKLLLYGLSTGAAYLVMRCLNSLLGDASLGFPSFDFAEPAPADFAMMLAYIPAGLLLYLVFGYSGKITGMAAEKIPPVASETICGAVTGLMAVFAPMVTFSGEEQMGELPETFMQYAPAALIGICMLKLVMTAFCIRFGMKGGHFFPLIFACSCMGFAVAATVFGSAADQPALTGHAVFAAAIITAATLGAQMKQPLAVSMLLLICFPLRYVLWIFIAAALAGRIAGRREKGSEGAEDTAEEEAEGEEAKEEA